MLFCTKIRRMAIGGKEFENLKADLKSKNVQLIAVSKTRSIEEIERFYHLGQRHFAENRVQELSRKAPELPDDIKWHLIGQLQTNKVKQALGHSHLIHSLDRLKLWKELNTQATINGEKIQALIQLKIGEEESKSGFEWNELIEHLKEGRHQDMPMVQICGVMGMASFTSDENQINQEFYSLNQKFRKLKEDFYSQESSFKEISMGMSSDYASAIENGSTMVRLGSILFGPRG